MELRHVRYFVAVAEELHFGRAAAQLGIAQPPLSQQIRQLEEELGVMLLWRNQRRVRLTAAGQAFLDHARPLLAQVDAAAQAARRTGRGETGQLVIGFVGSAMYELLPPLIRRFRERFPAVEVVLHQRTTAEQVAALLARQIDVGVLRPPITAQELQVETLLREPFVVALPAGHLLGGLARVPLARLRDEPFVIYPRQFGPGTYQQILALCARAGYIPRVVQEAVEMQTITGLVAAGLGVGLVPATVQRSRSTGIIYRPLEAVAPLQELALAWRRDDPPATLASLLTIVREQRTERQEP